MAQSASGIPLQICDVFIQEYNKVDSDAPLETIASLLQPFLKSMAAISNHEIQERIRDSIFHPLLENNKTQPEESETDEEVQARREHHYRHVDGGKLNPKTKQEIKELNERKYVFSGFNILIYAQNHVLKMASGTEDYILEQNREALYKLYEYAC